MSTGIETPTDKQIGAAEIAILLYQQLAVREMNISDPRFSQAEINALQQARTRALARLDDQIKFYRRRLDGKAR